MRLSVEETEVCERTGATALLQFYTPNDPQSLLSTQNELPTASENGWLLQVTTTPQKTHALEVVYSDPVGPNSGLFRIL